MNKITDANNKLLYFYKKNDIIETPKDVYDLLDDFFHFDFDPCPINPMFNGLECEWGDMNYVNPPYSEISKWLKKAISENDKNKKSLFLIPVRSNSKYWFKYVFKKAKSIFFIEKGICFKGFKKRLPIPLCFVYFGQQQQTDPGRLSDERTVDDGVGSSVSERFVEFWESLEVSPFNIRYVSLNEEKQATV